MISSAFLCGQWVAKSTAGGISISPSLPRPGHSAALDLAEGLIGWLAHRALHRSQPVEDLGELHGEFFKQIHHQTFAVLGTAPQVGQRRKCLLKNRLHRLDGAAIP